MNYSGGSLKGARIYTTLFPCNECTKAIIQAGISEVIYYSDKYADTDSTIAAKRMLDMVGISYRQYQREEKELTLHLSVRQKSCNKVKKNLTETCISGIVATVVCWDNKKNKAEYPLSPQHNGDSG